MSTWVDPHGNCPNDRNVASSAQALSLESQGKGSSAKRKQKWLQVLSFIHRSTDRFIRLPFHLSIHPSIHPFYPSALLLPIGGAGGSGGVSGGGGDSGGGGGNSMGGGDSTGGGAELSGLGSTAGQGCKGHATREEAGRQAIHTDRQTDRHKCIHVRSTTRVKTHTHTSQSGAETRPLTSSIVPQNVMATPCPTDNTFIRSFVHSFIHSLLALLLLLLLLLLRIACLPFCRTRSPLSAETVWCCTGSAARRFPGSSSGDSRPAPLIP